MNMPEKHSENIFDILGISADIFAAHKVLKKEDLTKVLKKIEPNISKLECRVVPSSFDPSDDQLYAYPLSFSGEWQTARTILQNLKPHGVMMFLPYFWQAELPLHTASRSAGAPMYINDPENVAVAVVATQTAGMDTVVSSANDASVLSAYLSDKDIQVRNWLIVHRPDTVSWGIPAKLLSADIHVFQEIHLFPSVPLFTQCEDLAKTKKELFHIAQEYEVEFKDEEILVSSKADALLPLVRYSLPMQFKGVSKCNCGLQTYERLL